jgi:hypothetical protein
MKEAKRPTSLVHGAAQVSSVTVDAYNAELRSEEGFFGDRASRRAFQSILDDWRERLRKAGDDPLGEKPTDEISKKKLDKILVGDDAEAAAVVHGAIEDFAQELAAVTRATREPDWRARHRPGLGSVESRRFGSRADSHPPPSERGGPDRLRTSCPSLDVPGP